MNRAERRRQQRLAKKSGRSTLAGRQHAGDTQEIQQALQLALKHHTAGRLPEAESIYQRVLQAHPNQPAALHLLGMIAQQVGKHDDAIELIGKSIAIKPDYAEAHYNLGNLFKELRRLDEAAESYGKSLAIQPNSAAALNNLGNVFKDLRRLDEAVASYNKALAIKPDHINAQFNLGKALFQLGKTDEAVACYHKVLAIDPGYAEAWDSLKMAAKVHQAEGQQDNETTPSFDDGLSKAERASTNYALLEFYLESFKPHKSDEIFRKTMAALPPRADDVVAVGGANAHQAGPHPVPEKLIALMHFGRSGTGLLHSLIDGHPEVSTLPSIYLRGYFNAGVWSKLSAQGWRKLPERFADEFAVLLDANSPQPTPGGTREFSTFLGRKEGMANVGENRDESLSLDRKRFCTEALKLLEGYSEIDPGTFLLIAHAAFERTLETNTNKHTVLYHIHNPEDFAKLNFLRYHPDARLVLMVREPIQCCESWLRADLRDGDYENIVQKIVSMLFGVDQVAFRTQDAVGVRLEDLKNRPEETMRNLSAWLGIADSPSLYHMTAQGKKWWGDPTSPDYDPQRAMSPFGKSSINRATGSVLSEKDQFVLRTLFFPFSVRFGYREPDPAQLKMDLETVRPLFDEMLDFEKEIADRWNTDYVQFKRNGAYRLLRACLKDRWDVLDAFGNYPHMLTPLAGKKAA